MTQFKKMSLFEFPATDYLFVSPLFGLFLQLFWPAPPAKTGQKVQTNYGYGETKRDFVAGNSNREIFLNCVPDEWGYLDDIDFIVSVDVFLNRCQ